MRKLIQSTLFCLPLLVLSMFIVEAQVTEDNILGEWLTGDKDGKVTIYEENGKLYGKITWMLEPTDDEGNMVKDINNPDTGLQKETVMGALVLKGFEYTGDMRWEEGTIYDPKNGKTYSCWMELESPTKLKVRGYIGFSLLGRTEYWVK